VTADVDIHDMSLLKNTWDFFRNVRLLGANYSPGLEDVWMGWPHRL
jgi:hypothetical protein